MRFSESATSAAETLFPMKMNLKLCPECRREVSERATLCPYCGFYHPQSGALLGAIYALLIFATFVLFIWIGYAGTH
jgi:hypothetical protein